MLRFRSFRNRLLVLILALMGSTQLATFLLVARVHRTSAESEIRRQLAIASDQFRRVVAQRNADLARSAAALSFDAGLRATLATTTDRATLRSALDSFRGRVDAGLVALLSLDGATLAETRDGPPADAMYRPMQQQADQAESARATGYGIVDGFLHSIAVVPLRAPDIVAWIAIGFRLDREFVDELKQSTGVEVTVRQNAKVLVSTLASSTERLITTEFGLPTAAGEAAVVVLQYSLDEKLAPARRLERVLAAVFVGSLVLAALLALGVARTVSQPVQQLAAHTQVIARGDYHARIDLPRADELGQLATAMNSMSVGLAERDRVRDLLDKNVSPEIAAQLMRDGAALGGQEREVTILFSDLRGFTTLSEKLAPRDLLTLLNRYLDRMSTEIENQGGVIDKFIGDAIMALFGAPVAQSDAADRALAAALAMERALADFNRELQAEAIAAAALSPPKDQTPNQPVALAQTLPKGLAAGIGVNTARVVVGNIGSHRRLNYSVIGDGVNVAARLEALTRTAEYRTNIITSAATLAALHQKASFTARPLGSVHVKGRDEPVEIYAVE